MRNEESQEPLVRLQLGLPAMVAGRNSAQQAANSDQRGVCFKFRDTGTCSRGEQCRFVHNTPDSNSALTSGSGSDTAQRRVKHDFAKAGPCPSGAACSKHPFLESWTFGKNPNGDIVALSPKKGPFISTTIPKKQMENSLNISCLRRK